MEEEPEEENNNKSTPSSKTSNKKTSFRDSMKYEVIRDYEKQFEENLLREASQQNRVAQKGAQKGNDNQR